MTSKLGDPVQELSTGTNLSGEWASDLAGEPILQVDFGRL